MYGPYSKQQQRRPLSGKPAKKKKTKAKSNAVYQMNPALMMNNYFPALEGGHQFI